MSDAAVGSISHILKTAFKDVYQDFDKRDRASQARTAIAEAEAEARRRAEEEEAIRLQREMEEAAKKPKKSEKAASKKDAKPEQAPVESEPPAPPPEIPKPSTDGIEGYFAPFEKLQLEEKCEELLTRKVQSVKEDLARKVTDAEMLSRYLQEEKLKARNLEEMEEEELKKQGIMLGQHIPSLQTRLDIRRSELEGYGVYSSNLLVAKNLIDNNYDNMLRRTGNLPISEMAAQRVLERTSKRQVTLDSNLPHYLQTTSNNNVRQSANLQRFSTTLMARDTMIEEKQLAESTKPPRKKFTLRKDLLTPAELDANEEIRRRVSHRMNYLRNPRNNPAAVTRMLTKGKAAFETVEGGASGVGDLHSVASKESASVSLAGKSAASHQSGSSTSRKSYAKEKPELKNPLFVSEPSIIAFSGYEIGQTMSMVVCFRNVSSISRTLRVIATSSTNFSISPLKYPANSQGGYVAPGMYASTVITFIPDSLGDFSDFLRVDTEGGSFSVPVQAQRQAPQLNLPSVLDVGVCLVGDASRAVISCHNSGGGGKFRLLPPDMYPVVPVDVDWKNMGCLRKPPFTVYPVEFTLLRGESIDLTIEYIPLLLGSNQQVFYLLCDNSQVREITVKGSCREVAVSLIEVNNVSINDADPSLRRELFFDGGNVGSELQQSVVVANVTGMPVEYEWVWVEKSCKDIRTAAMNQMQLRQQIEESSNFTAAGIMQTTPLGGERKSLTAPTASGTDENNATAPITAGRSAKTKEIELNETPMLPSRGTIEALVSSLEGNTPGTPLNSAVSGEFGISPARGVFPAAGLPVTFTVSFTAQHLDLMDLKAVLLLKHIPHASLPGTSHQAKYLKRLAEKGHGAYHRLRSWVEELGELGSVLEYQRFNGDISTTAKLTTVQVLLDMVKTHVGDRLSDNDKRRLKDWSRKIILHAFACRNQLLQMDEEDEEGAILSADQETAVEAKKAFDKQYMQEFIFYDWTGGTALDELSSEALYPLKLYTCEDPADSLKTEEETQYDDNVIASNMHLLTETWLDSSAALKFFGKSICDVLDELVKHEAIEFIQFLEHAAVVSHTLDVSGFGQAQQIQVSPSQLAVGGQLFIGAEWTSSFKLHNASPSMTEIEVVASELQVRLITRDGYAVTEEVDTTTTMDVDSKSFQVIVIPDRILLMPETSATLELKLVGLCPGHFEILVPVKPSNEYTMTQNVSVLATIVGPRFHFSSPEIDVGLIGISESETRMLTFTNESDVSARFFFKSVMDMTESFTAVKKGSITNSDNSRQNSSRLGTQRSELTDLSANSKDSFFIDNNAITQIVVEPPAGEIGPQQSLVVSVKCQAGSMPQRVRGLLDCSIFNLDGTVQFTSQFLSLRGEVQAPKTIVYPLFVDLGKVYLSRPVVFEVTLENLCNLPTKYRIERPGGDSSSYRLTIDKPKGPLGQKEKVVLRMEFVALTAGAIDDVISVKMFGVKQPLGFALSAFSKGIQLEVQPLLEGQLAPKPLVNATQTQFPDGGDPPEPKAIAPLELGSAVKLYERRRIMMTIQNFSAIPTPFKLAVNRFIVKDFNNPAASSSSVTVAEDGSVTEDDGMRKDLIIAPHEDGENIFKSKQGKEYVGVRLQRQEDLHYLKSGLGASFSIEPSSGDLPAWGVQVITIKAFNDMPGCYDDDLLCTVWDGNGARRETLVPIQMTVRGCPLIIEKNTVGMSVIRKGSDSDIGRQILEMGQACVGAAPLVREFTVLNNGSKPGKLKWKLKYSSLTINGPLRLKLRIDDNLKVKSQIEMWSDLLSEASYRIEPDKAVIPPYTRQSFTVTMSNTKSAGVEAVEMTGLIGFDESTGGSASSSQIIATDASSPSKDDYKLDLSVKGEILYPTIRLDKSTFAANDCPTLVPAESTIKLKAQAPILFARGKRPADICSRPLTLVNPLDTNLTFSIVVEGPFTIKQTASTSDNASAMVSPSSPSVVSSSTIGRTLCLLPNASATFSIAFTPKRDLRDSMALTRNQQLGEESTKSTDQAGFLILTFSTGHSLQFPLLAQLSTPFITASSPRLYFGVCHATKFAEGMLLLSNPTDVVAQWSVEHVPGAVNGPRITNIRVKGFESQGPEVDDPSVFEISPTAGSLEGPTLSVASTVGAPPKDIVRNDNETVVPQRLMESSWASSTLNLRDSVQRRFDNQHNFEADARYPIPVAIQFRPKTNSRYSSRFRFSCDFGNSFDVILTGQGTYEEHEHKPLNPLPR